MKMNGQIALLNTASKRAINIRRCIGTVPALARDGSPRLKANQGLGDFQRGG